MSEFLNGIIPNVMKLLETKVNWGRDVFGVNLFSTNQLLAHTLNTLIMVLEAAVISFVIGMAIGVILVVTKKGGILACHPVFKLFDVLINIFRSVPFIILIAALLPFTRAIVGTAFGPSVRAALIPLVLGTVPFFSRQIESALSEVDRGLIEAAESMGTSPLGIIFRVYIKESVPGIARGTTITMISLVGLAAIVDSTIGINGLGNLAINSGFARNKPDIIYIVVVLVFIIISVMQCIGSYIVKKTTH